MPVELHGYLAYIGNCAVRENPYTTYGYKGKQVRDQLHSSDVAQPMLEIYRRHRRGEVYNVGRGRANTTSILETISMLWGLAYLTSSLTLGSATYLPS